MNRMFLWMLLILTLVTSDVRSEDASSKSQVIMPVSNAYMKWDVNAIRIKSVTKEGESKKQFFLHLEGDILAQKVNSIAFQVNSNAAERVKFGKKKFDLDVLIEKVPSTIRLWMEIAKGRGIHLELYEVAIESEKRVLPNKKLINY